MKRGRGNSEVSEGYETESQSESVNLPIRSVAREKYQVLDNNPIAEAINNFADTMRATMSDLVRTIGHRDEEISNMIKQVFGELGLLPNLTEEERVAAAEMLVEKPNTMALFFCLPQKAKLILVRGLLKST